MKRVVALFAALALLSVTLAAAAKIREKHDPAYDFSKAKTFRFKTEPDPAAPDLEPRIRGELRAGLTAKGLREVPVGDETADLEVAFVAGAVDRMSAGLVVTAGWYGDLIAIPGAESHLAGGLLVEMYDAGSGKMVWAAAYIMKGNNPQTLQLMRDRAEKAVRGVLKKFPPK